MFQHTATRRWLPEILQGQGDLDKVSTHSHPKVAAIRKPMSKNLTLVSTHSHPKVAASERLLWSYGTIWFQHTATRRWLLIQSCPIFDFIACFNTQPPEGGCWQVKANLSTFTKFQHTATRRWLLAILYPYCTIILVSTHSHPKVAALRIHDSNNRNNSFNTQPPEGGCDTEKRNDPFDKVFQHTATRRWLQWGN